MKKLFCVAFFVLFRLPANATVIFLDSDSAGTTNNSSHATVGLSGTLHPNPFWAAALPGSEWISYGPTGDSDDPGYFSPPAGTLVMFTTSFLLSGAITDASLTVMADDSTSVILNGHTLLSAHSSTVTVFTFSELGLYLVDGMNTLSFGVTALGGSSYGLDFAGSVTDPAATPEPATLGFIGGGLIVFAGLRRRK